MGLIGLYALIIFVVFALVGGLAVFLIIRNKPGPGDDDLPPRGVPWDDANR